MKKITIVASMLLAVCLLPQIAMGQISTLYGRVQSQVNTRQQGQGPIYTLYGRVQSTRQQGQWWEVEKPEYTRSNYDGYVVYDGVKTPRNPDPVYNFEWSLQLVKFFEPQVIKEYYLSFKSYILQGAQKWPSYDLPETDYDNAQAREATIALCVLIESDRPYRRIFEYLFRQGANVLAERTDGSGNLTEIAAAKFGQDSPVTKMLLEQAEKERQHKKQ